VLALVCGCGSNSKPTGTHIVSVTGRIGDLHIDRSDRAAVIRFAGRPSAERAGRILNYAPYRALGYGCAAKRAPDRVELTYHGPYCTTAFFLARKTGKLATFFTSSPAYSERHGVRIGMRQAIAERLLHKRLTLGCTTALHFESATALLSVSFSGGKEHRAAVKGAHVDAFVVHGKKANDPGIFDCL
jgi:hypothetical protein